MRFGVRENVLQSARLHGVAHGGPGVEPGLRPLHNPDKARGLGFYQVAASDVDYHSPRDQPAPRRSNVDEGVVPLHHLRRRDWSLKQMRQCRVRGLLAAYLNSGARRSELT